MKLVKWALCCAVLFVGVELAEAQNRPASPRGEASTQVGADFDQWIVVDYGRPILRGRTGIFGSGESYGEKLNGGAPVWRLGANKSTQIMTQTDLMFGDKKLPAGKYSMYVDLKPGNWTLIISEHGAKNNYRDDIDGLWGSYNYTDDKDVLRAPMMVDGVEVGVDQLTISFIDVSATGGTLAIFWGNTMAATSFTVAN